MARTPGLSPLWTKVQSELSSMIEVEEPTLEVLNQVLAEIDPTTKEDVENIDSGVEKMVALLEVLGLKAPASERAGFRERLRRGEPRLLVSLLNFALSDLLRHKKTVYDARMQLPIAALAQQLPMTAHFETYETVCRLPMPTAPPKLFSAPPTLSIEPPDLKPHPAKSPPILANLTRQKATRQLVSQEDHPGSLSSSEGEELTFVGGPSRLYEQLIEVGLPETWDAGRLVELARGDWSTTKAKPWLTVKQRWKASARWLMNKKKELNPPKDSLHPTEAGAFSPRLLCAWSSEDVDDMDLAPSELASFCFPAGVEVKQRSSDDDLQSFVFRIAIPVPDAAQGAPPTTLMYGICVVDRRLTGTVEIPRCFCLLTKLPFLELHSRVLRAAVRFAKQVAGDEAGVRDVVHRVVSDYGRLPVPAPGNELRCQLPVRRRSDSLPSSEENGDGGRVMERQVESFDTEDSVSTPDQDPRPTVTELVFERPRADRSTEFLEDILSSSLASMPEDLRWTLRDLDHLDQAGDWSVPIFLAAVPTQNMARVLAAALCELQVVILSKHVGIGAAACLGLAALCRPLLWVGPLVPALPTQLHSILEAPTPFIVATPRTPVWVDCIESRVPHAGLVVLDVDAGAVYFHPSDADFVELPNSATLLAALQPALAVIRSSSGGPEVTPKMRKAARSAQNVIARHVARLCRITALLGGEKEIPKRHRTRESVEFAALLHQELAQNDDDSDDDDDDGLPTDAKPSPPSQHHNRSKVAASLQALRDSIGHSFLDAKASSQLQASLACDETHPLRRAFFERVRESQSFAVFREALPTFPAGSRYDDRLALDVQSMLGLPSPSLSNEM